MTTPRIVEALNLGLRRALEADPSVYVLGEDILDPYGGAFKVTKGLSESFPERIIATPISEAGIVGVATGMTLKGLRPVVEIMFGDFLTLCMDQVVNHASKFAWMFNDQVRVPLLIRTPMGGRRGYGPTHSQTLEKLFYGVPGVTILAVSPYHDVTSLLSHAILEDDSLKLFIENKLLYPERLAEWTEGYTGIFAGRMDEAPYPTITLSPVDFAQPHVTVATYGGMAPLVTSAVQRLLIEEEIYAEVVIPSQVMPLSLEPLLESVRRSHRVVVVEEGTRRSGWGAELAASLQEEAFSDLRAPVQRVAALDLPIANSKPLEDAILPQEEDIIRAVQRAL